MILFVSGAVTFAFLVAAIFFLKFWKSTADRLFLGLGIAFFLFALNQLTAALLGPADERSGYSYLLRVIGFSVILVAIISKNYSKDVDKSEL